MKSQDLMSVNSLNNNINTNTNNNRGQKSSRYKGVVPQQNGHWGAQIYANHHRIWLGTFKTEAAAASAYDSAAVKLRPGANGETHRNFALTSITAKEAEFQVSYSTDQVLNMIKDGSYPNKFGEYLSNISRGKNGDSQTGRKDENEGYFCQELFRKELTPSDVGKLNRLVIPKRYAVKFFPKGGNNCVISCLGKDDSENLELLFYDKAMKSWSFRYCYWKSSQSFVFTRGWNKFVKDKDLKAKDIVAFYMCVLKDNDGNIVNQFYMIDLVPINETDQTHDHRDIINNDDDDHHQDDEEQIPEDHKGFRLFGVNIC